ncbi:hypothetical protein [Methylobacterium sp. Leaf118]|uniref:hypothetical protein n=1 Tax=Methylobacterium sp. Leaf118 TaxID=2876562 RepID=UPI001E374941|nr:hypothetical protein [Methylobacterium sp. Leaf118]
MTLTAEDTIRLSRSIFEALAAGEFDPGRFTNITTDTADADVRILYEPATGELIYDADGLGRGVTVRFAVLDHKPALTSDDVVIVGGQGAHTPKIKELKIINQM